ncbi:hypothetical protein CR513_23593, partial [Mucuna pruriens]
MGMLDYKLVDTPIFKNHHLGDLCIARLAPRKRLMFSKNNHLDIKGYTNIDWVGSVTYRRSTSSYFTFVARNLVTWRRKK